MIIIKKSKLLIKLGIFIRKNHSLKCITIQILIFYYITFQKNIFHNKNSKVVIIIGKITSNKYLTILNNNNNNIKETKIKTNNKLIKVSFLRH